MSRRTWRMGLVEGGICIDLNEYNPDLNRELKGKLPGPAKWDRNNKWWVFPLHWDTCVDARKVANEWDARIKIAPSLREWAEGEKERQAAIPSVQSMDLVDLPQVRESHPQMWEALRGRPFQTVGAAFAARNRSCLIADQPGLGKTVQTLAAIVESGVTGPILVCAPKAAAKLTWPQEIKRWLGEDEIIFEIGSHLKAAEREQAVYEISDLSENGAKGSGRIWVITSPNYLRIKAEVDQYGKYERDSAGRKIITAVGETQMGLLEICWSAVVVDESHQTLAGASGDKKKQSAQRLGLGALDIREGGLRIALSGTPFRGKEEYLWGQLNWLRPDKYRSRWRWIKQFFDSHQDRYGMVIGRISDHKGMYEDAANVMIRRTKAEVAKDLPAKTYAGAPLDPKQPNDAVAIWLPMEARQAKAYDDIKRKAEADLEGGVLMVNGVLPELTRLKQFAGSYGKMVDGEFRPTLPSNKYDWLLEWLDERGIDKSVLKMDRDKVRELPKVVVASQFSSLIDVFAQALLEKEGILSYKFTGATNDRTRTHIMDRWQNDPEDSARILLMTTTAGGTGITLDAADDLITLDETWDVSAMEQLEDRIHRLSRMHQVTIWPVRSLGTIEEGIARANLERDLSIKEIIDGSRGVDFMPKLLGGGQ